MKNQTIIEGQETIHAVVDYVLSKAVMQGKVGSSQVFIKISDLLRGEYPLGLDSKELLKVEVKTAWATQDECDEAVKSLEGEENETDDSTGA